MSAQMQCECSVDTSHPCRAAMRLSPPLRGHTQEHPTGGPHLVSEEAIVHKDAVQPLLQHFVHQHCCHSAVHPSGECTDDMIIRPNLQPVQGVPVSICMLLPDCACEGTVSACKATWMLYHICI